MASPRLPLPHAHELPSETETRTWYSTYICYCASRRSPDLVNECDAAEADDSRKVTLEGLECECERERELECIVSVQVWSIRWPSGCARHGA